MPESRWKGYIKDYSGSTMMQCKIHKGIDYAEISNTIKLQRKFVIDKIHEIMTKKIYPALDFSTKVNQDFSFDFSEILGLAEAGWTKKEYEEVKGSEEKTFEQQCSDILDQLTSHENSWPFRKAVSQK